MSKLEACPLCNRTGPPGDVPHEGWCPHYMRTVDECDGRQLALLPDDDLRSEEPCKPG